MARNHCRSRKGSFLEFTLRKNYKTWVHQGLREIPIPKKDGSKRILKVPTIAEQILAEVEEFLAKRGMEVSQKKTKVTASTDGFDFLGWHFYVQKNNGKFRSTPSTDNFKAFRAKVKHIVNNSNYGASTKVSKLAPVVRGWRAARMRRSSSYDD